MKRRPTGAALLAAMLTVTLVATFAASALWQQWRSVEIEQAERTRVQSAWILTGALDWARLILREDARTSAAAPVDHLGEPWAVPLQEARLSTFLAADKANTMDTQAENAFLSGAILDLQALMNVNNLVNQGNIDERWMQSFSRLFELLGLPQAELNRVAENLRFANDIHVDNRSSSQAGLQPLKPEQLVWLGLSVQSAAVLQPYVTLLPEKTAVNLNTAAAEVIYAAASGLSMADAQRLVAERDRGPFRTPAAAAELVGNPQALQGSNVVGVNSRYFEVRGRLRLGDIVVEERSLVRRELNGDTRTVWRERGVVDPTALTRAAMVRR